MSDDHLFQPTPMFGLFLNSAADWEPPHYLFRFKEDAEEFLKGFEEEFPGSCTLHPCTVQGVRRNQS